jgi:hypothetical protein
MNDNTKREFEPGQYKILAGRIATALAAGKDKAKGATKDRESAWGLFKSAIKFAADNGHTPEQMREGLGVYCLLAGIPQGTVNGYITVTEQLAIDYNAGKLDSAKLADMSIADARDRYLDADKRAAKEAKAALLEVVKEWTGPQIRTLLELASEAVVAAAPSQTNKGAVTVPTPDRVQEPVKLLANG